MGLPLPRFYRLPHSWAAGYALVCLSMRSALHNETPFEVPTTVQEQAARTVNFPPYTEAHLIATGYSLNGCPYGSTAAHKLCHRDDWFATLPRFGRGGQEAPLPAHPVPFPLTHHM